MTFMFKKSVSLQDEHTFGLPWETDYFCELKDEGEVEGVLSEAQNQNLPILILGGGSNLLPTKTFEGLVIHNKLSGIEQVDEAEDVVLVRVASGEDWHRFVLTSIENGWYGLENLSLIPGTVGGAVVQNIGAYDVDIARFVDSVETYHVETAEKRSFSAEECKFDYRNSLFKKTDEWLVTSVTLNLSRTFTPVLTYKPLEHLASRSNLDAKEVSQEVIKIRQSKLPDWNKIGTAGSFFANSRVDQEKADQLKEKFPEIPLFNNYGTEEITVPAGWLIQNSSLGAELREEFLYPKHSLVVVNKYKGGEVPEGHGHATKDFITNVQSIIEKDFGITLRPEVRIF